jgi:DNA-binding transcriptional ArsR family regulator
MGGGKLRDLLAGEGLQPSSRGARVKFSGGKPSVVDGPFAETKELIAGFWIIQVRSREEAVEWARRIPFREGEVEIQATVTELAEPFEISLPGISKHLKVLERAGLIERGGRRSGAPVGCRNRPACRGMAKSGGTDLH